MTSKTGPNGATFVPRLGVAVATASRTCVAIQNATLQANTPITIVNPLLPQTFTPGVISGPSSSACPVTEQVQPGVSSYDIKVTGTALPKLTPLIAVINSAAVFTMNNINVQADLNQDRSIQTFRACSANDGVHLTVWNGTPLSGPLLWHGYYYEASNPGLGPNCSPTETVGP